MLVRRRKEEEGDEGKEERVRTTMSARQAADVRRVNLYHNASRCTLSAQVQAEDKARIVGGHRRAD